ncbi:MAG TPA: hypothetical protein VF173_00100 [Thermoanaerobaculia bacterium]|nr:hypothetical protein [Thermoanaerobaculia bacterium]
MRNELVNIGGTSASLEAGSPVRLSFAAARSSPCSDCAQSPCCTYLPLQTFSISTLAELDNAAFLLNFDRIELNVNSAGLWSAYYAQPCSFLDAGTYGCRLHGTPEQPDICVHYNPYQCFYKPAFRGGGSEQVIRMDRARLEHLSTLVAFDEDRNVCDQPDWETTVRELARLPLAESLKPAEETPPEEDPTASWRDLVLLGRRPGDGAAAAFNPADPCEGCGAWCCKSLIFPQPVPATATNLDYFRFCLGFPGVQLGIAEGVWAVMVMTRCRHLVGNRCSVYGLPERPLRCRYYSAQSCGYKPVFTYERPENLFRIGRAELPALTSLISFDAYGQVEEMPPVARIRERIEEGFRAIRNRS